MNPIYIDVEKVPFYEECDKDGQAIWFAKERRILTIRQFITPNKGVAQYFARLKANEGTDYYKEFEAFKAADTGELHRLAVFRPFPKKRARSAIRLPKTGKMR